MCVTRGVVLLCCGLVLSPRGLSSFTEPWQKMEAGRGVCCIKKPLPCSDLSPLPHTLTRTQTHTPIHLTTPRHLTLLQLDSTLYQTQTYSIDTHARMHTHMHTPTHTEPHTPSNTHLFHHKMAASEKEWGSEVLHYATVVILHFNGTPPLSPPSLLSLCRVEGRQTGSGHLTLTAGRPSDTITEQRFPK